MRLPISGSRRILSDSAAEEESPDVRTMIDVHSHLTSCEALLGHAGPRKYLILLTNYEFILRKKNVWGQGVVRMRVSGTLEKFE
jgi:hypothetical protein